MWCHTTNPSISPCQWCCKINVELPMMLCFLAEPIFCQRTYAAISAIHLYSFYTDLGHLTYVVIIAILSWSLYTLLTNLMHFANAVMIAIFYDIYMLLLIGGIRHVEGWLHFWFIIFYLYWRHRYVVMAIILWILDLNHLAVTKLS
jgi:hypothetical protein